MYVLRRILNPMGTMDAIDFLLDKLRNTKNNSEFFEFDEYLSHQARAGEGASRKRGAFSCCGMAATGSRKSALAMG